MTTSNNTHSFNHCLKTKEDQGLYIIQMKRRRNWWWLLLLLLPLLLFIRCDHDIVVDCVETGSHEPVKDAYVSIDFTAHYLFHNGRFFCKERYHKEKQADSLVSRIIFRDVPCNVYSYIFYSWEKGYVKTTHSTLVPKQQEVTFLYHSDRHVLLEYERIKTDVQIHVVDAETRDDIPAAKVDWSNTVDGKELSGTVICDSKGHAVLGAATYHRIFDRMKASAEEYHDSTFTEIDVANSVKERGEIVLPLRPIHRTVTCDLVMCIDNTGSMESLMQTVKNNAQNFYVDLNNHCRAQGKRITNMHIRVIAFGDFNDSRLVTSEFFSIPEKESDYRAFVNNLGMTYGGDNPENGLEALATAIKSDWHKGDKMRHVIVIYTNAEAHSLGYNRRSPYYPSGMPANFAELTSWWDAMNLESKKLILFAPNDFPWSTINRNWANVTLRSDNLSSVLSGKGYDDILEAISASL